ncbi:AUX/IAA domain [Dillenia turbinata]|uniref:Auxin-responsive protein n=1 Tax=Dillenia turbinata TaxID=194707 RepID=A0AAN8URH2_9MAGN
MEGISKEEEKKLELRLGPPGQEEDTLFSFAYLSSSMSNNTTNSAKRVFSEAIERKTGEEGWINLNSDNGIHQHQKLWSSSSANFHGKIQHQQQQTKASFLQFQTASQSLPVMAKESSQPCCNKIVDLQQQSNAEKKAFSPSSANPAVSNISQKRTAPAPVVGWPPIRSFRKNLASSSSAKPNPDSQGALPDKVAGKKPVETCRKGLFVKINMDGVPIGRKVDLMAYDCYDKLSSAVDELFRGLVVAQRDSSGGGKQNNQEEKPITGLLDGSGEYTLVYEDNEGDRMLVGDVPWHMFVSTAKRLRVLKTSEVSGLCLGGGKQGKPLLESA